MGNTLIPPIFQAPPTQATEFLGKDRKLTFPWYSFILAVAVRITRIVSSVPPTTSTANGSPGQIAFDANFIYVCIATNTWKRIALVAF